MRLNGWRLAMQSPISHLMHVYWRFARGLTMGVRAVVIDGKGCVFLVKHSYTDGWHLPGGGVEAGETLLDALARELAEEGNIELAAPPALHGVYYHPKYSNRDHIALYVVRAYRQPSKPAPNREIIAHGFFPLDALPPETTSGTRARLAEVLGGAFVSPNW
jgi:8-oxo-dGTP pyrophosphatase MutT (NUDIX family)